ncbi:hypothetical protein AQUCO_00700670v1 [Aquilegia coerulea]|uniref:Uncharacterized protein n=1 Tax=Aquilegia coerulea TaxID=218851 RepID=A0A2G5EL86_AQUCA|nr:hypothetical protein AQUCO_00700670v1 [Aquilegia coerulea]
MLLLMSLSCLLMLWKIVCVDQCSQSYLRQTQQVIFISSSLSCLLPYLLKFHISNSISPTNSTGSVPMVWTCLVKQRLTSQHIFPYNSFSVAITSTSHSPQLLLSLFRVPRIHLSFTYLVHIFGLYTTSSARRAREALSRVPPVVAAPLASSALGSESAVLQNLPSLQPLRFPSATSIPSTSGVVRDVPFFIMCCQRIAISPQILHPTIVYLQFLFGFDNFAFAQELFHYCGFIIK